VWFSGRMGAWGASDPSSILGTPTNMANDREKVDILTPPTFEKSGQIKLKQEAWQDGDWIATFNLWIVQDKPEPAIIYQQRSLQKSWAPGKLDVTAGGHLLAGEKIIDGLREVKEELGKTYPLSKINYLGRKLHVSPDTQGNMRQNVVHIYFTLDNSNPNTFRLDPSEVHALCICPIQKLINVHTKKRYSFVAPILDSHGSQTSLKVTQASFPYNWDNYHFKIALLAKRFLKGEKHLLY